MTAFKTWICKQTKRQDGVGDFAKDVRADSDFPRRITKANKANRDAVESHLEDLGACDGALKSFDRAWTEWIESERGLGGQAG